MSFSSPQLQATSASGLSIGSGSTILVLSTASITANRTISFQDSTDTLVGRATTDTMTNKTLTAPVISTIVNTGTLTLPTSTDTLVGRATTDTMTNKTLTAPVISTIVNTGTLTLPTSTDTLVGRDTTDTMTNKTLTAPVISTISNTGTLTLPTSTDTLVGKATTDTLTNKTLAGVTNTIEANKIGQAANAVTISGAAAAGYVLTATSSSAATWSPGEAIIQGTLTTSNATQTAVTNANVLTEDDTCYNVSSYIIGRNTTTNDTISAIIRCAYKRGTGAASLVQLSSDVLTKFNDSGASTWAVSSFADTTGGNIQVRVTGQAATTINWKVRMSYLTVV